MHDCPVSESQSETRSAKCQLHGVLLRVFDTGVLLLGESGIGKSECALDLITKGHRFVADDAVDIIFDHGKLVGKAPELTRDLIEIRGLGIINVREIFGEQVVSDESEIDLCIELQKWAEVERIGNVVYESQIAGRPVPRFVLPVSSGRNLATLVETAVRLHRNSHDGPSAAELLIEKHARLLDPIQ